MYTIDHLPGRTIQFDGREHLFFSGTAYLGIAQNPAFRALLAESMERYGTVFGSSRNGNLRLGIYEEAEEKLARFAGLETALTMSSGMMAGQVVVQYLRAEGYGFLYAPGAHPAIWQDARTQLPRLSFGEWTAQVPRLVEAAGEHLVIALNSLDAVRSEAYPFDWVAHLPADRQITLLVDDSHGLGVIGPDGSGIAALVPKRENVRLLITASLAKALGLPGGVVLGDSETLAAIRHTAFFGACSPISPAYLAAFVRAEDLYRNAYGRLNENIRRAESLLDTTGLFAHIPGYPVFYTPHDGLYPSLLDDDILIYQFAYPTPADKPNTRLVISALHTPDDLGRLGTAVGRFAQTVSQSR
ncbi:aminotransferase class I/II-fold pyridoxal phosphate-dependent enzyme [Tellurirhabdus rosea]|uniref:aminotransferase class I/II-fold pyridoxal phosphate-dependent enzyme n=1 Tax=Tellurirhabdus rosea TaxID=2674997 RepID=UPI00225930B3|nr:aminotransferase class I/II-fold pyridoxal phosphate-dependent enzyme [Tellurirhabdus rosea]